MAKLGDFSELGGSRLVGVPGVGRSYAKLRNARMLAVSANGSLGFLADFDVGVFRFDPRSPAAELEQILSLADLDDEPPAGLQLLFGDGQLLITTNRSVFSYDVPFLGNKKKAKWIGRRVADGSDCANAIVVGSNKGKERKKKHDEEEEKAKNDEVHFRDATRFAPDGDVFAVGHPRSGSELNAGMAIFRISEETKRGGGGGVAEKNNGTTLRRRRDCVVVAGNVREPVGWRDGKGDEARFSRPHSLTALPGDDHQLVVTDIDNRAVRVVDVSKGRVASVVYNDNLFGQWHEHQRPKPRLQVLLPSKAGTRRLTHPEADASCRRHGAELCDPKDLLDDGDDDRKAMTSRILLSDGDKNLDGVLVWTSRRCASCWLHFPGDCPPPSQSDNTRNGSSWGDDVSVLAYVHRDSRRRPILRAECVDEAQRRDVLPLCCE
mmetsp:Transcript_9119/g.29542  ORF Transcript_9119/g.29542 Transcript_9119/m.29542 type:complete len:435 (-) Transcript_9119:732-2036(-)